MSTLTILTRKSINKDQWVFISSGSLLERIDCLNKRSNSDDMVSLFYSETGKIFLKFSLEQPYLCFPVTCFFSVVDVLMNSPNLQKHKIQMLFLSKTLHWFALQDESLVPSPFICLSLILFYLLISYFPHGISVDSVE